MTAMIASGLTKIDSFYDFFFYNTCKITVSFFNDCLKKSLAAHFALAKARKLRVTPSQGGEGIFTQMLDK